MLRNSLLATLLIAASIPAWAFEVKPGLWETTSVMEGDQLPAELRQETIDQHCMTAEEAQNPESAIRKDFNEAGFTNIDLSQSNNTISAKASNSSAGQNVEIEISITKHSDEHTSSRSQVTSSETLVTTQESRWVSEDC